MRGTQKLQIAKSDMANRRQGKRRYSIKEFKAAVGSAYRLGLQDGEEGYVIKPDVSGLYGRVRIRMTGNRNRQGRRTDQTLSPYYVQLNRAFDKKWVAVELCENQDEAIAFLEDIVLILARGELRRKGKK